jgi:hypothetical protein
MANPHPDRSSFGMLTNGDEMLFVKVNTSAQYSLSRIFSPFVANAELVTVLQILQQLGNLHKGSSPP